MQYVHWVGDFVQGDLGNYWTGDRLPAGHGPGEHALPVSLQLMLYAQVLALAVAIPLGVATAYRAGSRFDRSSNATAFGLLAIPNCALALVLAYYVGVQAGWLPVSGYVSPSEDLIEHFRRMAMPAIALAVGQIAVYMRLLRAT